MRSDIVFVHKHRMTITGKELKAGFPREWGDKIAIEKVRWDNIASVLNNDTFMPKYEDIFAAFRTLTPSKVKVVILGQDPYPTAGVAHGYSFSVQPNAQIPPSLRNIHIEIMNEYGLSMHPANGSLLKWSESGVLLLNTVLTVRVGEPKSHFNIGWEQLTSQVIEYLDSECDCIFLAWGNPAKEMCRNHVKRNEVVSCGHPSPLNSSTRDPFLGSGCFKKVNEILIRRKQLPVVWTSPWGNRLE